MIDNQKHICFECKHHICEKIWNGEEEQFVFLECRLEHETSPIWDIECEDFEHNE